MSNSNERIKLSPDDAAREAERIMRATEVGRSMYEAIEVGEAAGALDTPDDSERNKMQSRSLEEYAEAIDKNENENAQSTAIYDPESDTMWEELDSFDTK